MKGIECYHNMFIHHRGPGGRRDLRIALDPEEVDILSQSGFDMTAIGDECGWRTMPHGGGKTSEAIEILHTRGRKKGDTVYVSPL
ncbi:MAG TPA: hypothetical protein VJB96_05830 [Patescibacteria group bacterium]|nr:hypothetical protein [Patescibacteria group bacterium]